ncbi:MAG: hypothetical protein NC548_57500 [Lachnospiraceae bacterium]|nr:hypothetical protein [Lachnospiraceae bacterium]
MNGESYVERWKREQAEKERESVSASTPSRTGRTGRKSQRRRKEVDQDGRAEDQRKTEGE